MTPVAVGVDVGGTKIAAGIVDARGAVLRAAATPTPATDGAGAVLEAAGRLARDLVAWARARGLDVRGCGAGVAGVLDGDGTVTSATDSLPGWVGTDVAGGLRDATGLRTRVVNDVHALALGEARLGAAAGAGSALVVAVGTGVGGAYVHDGVLLVGRTGTAGSVGHVPVEVGEGRRCTCGATDHLEAYASGPSIVARLRERGGEAQDVRAVVRAAAEGDTRAGAVLSEAGALLGRAVAGVMNVLDPGVVVLGGGVVRAGERLLRPLRDAVAAHALPGPRGAPVVLSATLDHGAVVGAASLWLPRAAGPGAAARPARDRAGHASLRAGRSTA